MPPGHQGGHGVQGVQGLVLVRVPSGHRANVRNFLPGLSDVKVLNRLVSTGAGPEEVGSSIADELLDEKVSQLDPARGPSSLPRQRPHPIQAVLPARSHWPGVGEELQRRHPDRGRGWPESWRPLSAQVNVGRTTTPLT